MSVSMYTSKMNVFSFVSSTASTRSSIPGTIINLSERVDVVMLFFSHSQP